MSFVRVSTALLGALFLAAAPGCTSLLGDFDFSGGGTTSTGGTGGTGGAGGTTTQTCTSPDDCAKPPTSCVLATCVDNHCGTENASPGVVCFDSGGAACNGMGACVPSGSCVASETRCQDNSPQACVAGKWMTVAACDAAHPKCCAATTECIPSVVGVAAGGAHACAVLSDGTLWCWGANDKGQLGAGSSSLVPQSTPSAVGSLMSSFAEVVAGPKHTCARTTSGKVYCWGDNGVNQLGLGSVNGGYATPQEVIELNDTVQLAASPVSNHTCARKQNGSIWCWGVNSSYEAGQGSGSSVSTPMEVTAAGTGNIDVKVGGKHTCVIANDQTVLCWGANTSGQLGNVAAMDKQLTPISPDLGNTTVLSVATGFGHTCVVEINGSVWCWGHNTDGEIGFPVGTDKPTPAAVTALASGVSSIVAGNNGTCAVKTDGTALCWGNNRHGEAGIDGAVSTDTPTPVTPLAKDAAAIFSGDDFNCALLKDSTFRCWGAGSSGQLADGWKPPAFYRSVPVLVPLGLCRGDRCHNDKTDTGETAKDCGGDCVAVGLVCEDMQGCAKDSDCVSLTSKCDMDTKTCKNSCADFTKDGSETDMDCGGERCPRCTTGKACKVDGDCETSHSCTNLLCD